MHIEMNIAYMDESQSQFSNVLNQFILNSKCRLLEKPSLPLISAMDTGIVVAY